MSKTGNAESIWHQWGGSTAAFFGYTHFSHDLSAGLLLAMLPLIRESMGLNYLQSGILLSAYAFTSGLCQLPGGWIGDRVSRRLVIATGLAGIGVTSIAVGLSPSYYVMLAVLVVRGVFSGAYHPSAVATLSSHIEVARRGKAISVHVIGGTVGFTLGPIFGGLIANALGWRFAFIILSIVPLVAIPPVLKRLKQLPEPASSHPINQPATKDIPASQSPTRELGFGQVLRAIAVIGILVILIQLIGSSVTAFIPLYLVDKHHIVPVYAVMLVSILRGGGIVGSLFGGWLSDRWGRKNAIYTALIATGPILYLLTRLPFGGGLIVVFILLGMVAFMRQATVQPFLMDSTPPHLRATMLGLYFGLALEGVSVLHPFAGYFMDVFGIINVFHVMALAGVGLSVITILLAIRDKLQRSNKIIS